MRNCHMAAPHRAAYLPSFREELQGQPAKTRVRLWVSFAYVACVETGRVAIRFLDFRHYFIQDRIDVLQELDNPILHLFM